MRISLRIPGRSLLFSSFLAAALIVPSIAAAQLDATIEIVVNGSSLGFNNPIPGRDNQIPLEGFASGVVMNFDSLTGSVGGAPLHQPVIIVKRIDQTTPLIYMAMIQIQAATATIRFYLPSAPGSPYFEIELSGASISSVQNASGTVDDVPTEAVSINFGTIQWTAVDGGYTYSSTWLGPPP